VCKNYRKNFAVDTALFDYTLPSECIAQTPAQRRDAARLMVVHRATGRVEHLHFADLPGVLPERARLFRNNASVLKARLRGQKDTGGAVECFLLRPAAAVNEWVCLLKPGRRLPPGAAFGQTGAYRAEVVSKDAEGNALVRFHTASNESVLALSERIGSVPLPPYIARTPGDARAGQDAERYQTVYADPSQKVAVAAPTAGLHFSPEVLAALSGRGVPFYDVTLHVGLGTFRPVQVERIEDHPIHHEWYHIPQRTLAALHDRAAGPRVAVGTTTLRAVEDAFAKGAIPGGDFAADADIYIYPPRAFAGVDALITNFHLPRSTLLCLVSAFLTPGETRGIAWLKELYADAIARGYRFFSYGDAMLLL